MNQYVATNTRNDLRRQRRVGAYANKFVKEQEKC